MASNRYKLNIEKTGGSFENATFSHDSALFLVCCGSHINVSSVATGITIHRLRSNGNAPIFELQRNPFNNSQVYGAYRDGLVVLWDYVEGIMLNTWQTSLHLIKILPSSTDENMLYISGALCDNQRLKNRSGIPSVASKKVVKSFNLSTLKSDDLLSIENEAVVDMAYTCEQSIVIACSKSYTLLNTISESIVTKRLNSKTLTTAMAMHPTQPIMALGNKIGAITLVYMDSRSNRGQLISSDMHWHSHAVNSLAFSGDGVYLFSGGEEAVFVVWQLETRSKEFFPRLGSEIKKISVSPNQLLYALSHVDNSIKIISATDMHINHSVGGIKASHLDFKIYPMSVGIQVEPLSGHLVVNGLPGSLQVYDIDNEQTVSEIEISPRNRISRTDEEHIRHSHVQHAKYSSDGKWLVSVENRNDPDFENDCYLKFWKYDVNSQTYILNSMVDKPHLENINFLEISPLVSGKPLLALTTSDDETFKIWELVNISEKEQWICKSTMKFKKMAANAAAFSGDGSVVAVSFGSVITLWDPNTGVLQRSLYSSHPNNIINSLVFSGTSPFLVSHSANYLDVWSLLTCKIEWSLRMPISILLMESKSGVFSVVRKDKKCFHIFDPQSANPIFTAPIHFSPIAAAFVKVKDSEFTSNIVFMDDSLSFQRWSCESRKSVEESKVDDKLHLAPALTEKQSLFMSVYGDSFFKDITSSKAQTLKPKRVEPAALKFLDAPSHIVAPPSKLIKGFMNGLLIHKKDAAVPDIENVEIDVKNLLEKNEEMDNNDDLEIDCELPSIDTFNDWPESEVFSFALKKASTSVVIPINETSEDQKINTNSLLSKPVSSASKLKKGNKKSSNIVMDGHTSKSKKFKKHEVISS